MLLPRRISEKKCRFTAKKITFLEFQRVKRLELTKKITERKRLGATLFLPQVLDEVNSLSHESVQRILNQGSLFHSITTNSNVFDKEVAPRRDDSCSPDFDSVCTIADDSLDESPKGSLNDLLYGRIFNVRCLSNHDLCILLSYLIKVAQFSQANSSILCKVLEQTNLKFETLSISEISHILFSITQLVHSSKVSKYFFQLSCNLVNKTTNLLFKKEGLSDLTFVSSSNLSKLLYCLTDPVFVNHSSNLTSLKLSDRKRGFEELINAYSNYLGDEGPNSREFTLVCETMIRLDCPNYDLLKKMACHFWSQLRQVNSHLDKWEDDKNCEGINNVDKLYYLDQMDEKVDLKELFVLLRTNEHFGVNDRNLLNEFNEYIENYLNTFGNDQFLVGSYTSKEGEGKRRKLLTLLKNDKFMKNNRLNLPKIYSEIGKESRNSGPLWDFEVCQKMSKYVNKTQLFKKYITNMAKIEPKFKELLNENILGSELKNKGDSGNELEKEETIKQFVESVEYLPKVINFSQIWRVFKLVNKEKRRDLVPAFCNYIQESSIIFERLEEPSEDLLEIFSQIVDDKSENHLLEIDNISKVAKMFMDCDLKRDQVGLKTFFNMFKVLVRTCEMERDKFEDFDQCGSLTFIQKELEEYFRKYGEAKNLEFEEVPEKESCLGMVRLTLGANECKNSEEMVKALELLEEMEGRPGEVVGRNRDVFKFVLYNGFLEGMQGESEAITGRGRSLNLVPNAHYKMTTGSVRPKLATLDELLNHELYKRLVSSMELVSSEMKSVKTPRELVNSDFAKEIVEIYKTLFSGSFSKLDMASLEHSDYLSYLLPCLSLESFPLIANLESKSQEEFKKVRLCSVMTCVWCFVELHSSGRSEYVDVLSNVSTRHKESFECLFLNAAQLLMVESWKEDLCESREFEECERVTVLEQRALLRFFIVCFQRIELAEVRRCCMALLSPQVWIHIPEELREENFFKNNQVSKLLFLKAMENYKAKHKLCDFKSLLKSSADGKDNVERLYELEANDKNVDQLNLSRRLVLSRDFVNSILNQFIYILEDHLSSFQDKGEVEEEVDHELMKLMYIENFLELFIDLLSQLHIRRIIKPIIENKLLLVRCKNHNLYEDAKSKYDKEKRKRDSNVFVELVNILEYYLNFNINEELGVRMDYNVIMEEYYKRFNKFQRVCYINYKEEENLKNIHLINNYTLNTKLSNMLENVNMKVLVELNQKLYLIQTNKNEKEEEYLWPYKVELTPKKKKPKKLVRRLLISNLTSYLRKPLNEWDLINGNNFYLNPFSSVFSSNSTLNPEIVNRREEEEVIEVEEDMNYVKMGTLSLFKLNLQYLTLFDYLYRNFILYQFEVIYQVKQYIQQQVFILFSFSKVNNIVSVGEESGVKQEGKETWVGRMFISISKTEMKISTKKAEMTVTVDLSLIQDYKIRQEWQQLTKHDIVYLIQLVPKFSRFSTGNKEEDELLWGKDVKRIRFGEVVEILDEENNNVLEFNPLDNKSFAGFKMRMKLLVDYEQYIKDVQEDMDYYSSFNLVMRRSKRQNNFKSILTNIQRVFNNKIVIPNWLQVILLGYIHSVPKKSKKEVSKEEVNNEKENVDVVKRRKIMVNEDKIGVNYLNTFKSKEHLLSTTKFISVKLIPVLASLKNGNLKCKVDERGRLNKENKSEGLGRENSNHVDKSEGYLNEEWEEEGERENRMYVDELEESLNEYVYNSKGNFKKEELVERVKLSMMRNQKVKRFIERYLNLNWRSVMEGKDELGLKGKRKGHKEGELVELHGVQFELYVEESYLNDLTKTSNNYYVGKNQVPRFLVSNFNEPCEVKTSYKYHLTHNNTNNSNNNNNNTTNNNNNNTNNTNNSNTNNVNNNNNNNTTNVGSDNRAVKFVSRQVETIVSGSLEGLTVVMGPPGTGKTDVVSQIIAILFNNFESEKIVICTHSNFALNDIFTKLVRNELIDEHYMVRLGHSDLEVDQMGRFSKYGRVNYILQRRLDLLEVIKNLKEQLGVRGDYEYTIQYSLSFLQYYLLDKDQKFQEETSSRGQGSSLEREEVERGLESFFKLDIEYPQTLKNLRKLHYETKKLYERCYKNNNNNNSNNNSNNTNNNTNNNNNDTNDNTHDNNDTNSYNNENNNNNDTSDDVEVDVVDIGGGELEKRLRLSRKRFVEKLYESLNELLPFEVLRSNRDRMKYLVENYSRIVAMTCTHASIAREELETLDYKSLIFEEAAQILEIESFVPISKDLRRLVLCGDHLQLSPIIQNGSLQKYANLNQSMFLRLIRLNYPYVQLNVQARSRPEILKIYKDFYPQEIYTLGVNYLNEGGEEIRDELEVQGVKREGERERVRLINVGRLKKVLENQKARVGLKYVVQFIDVEGEESSPIRYFYQNLEEAHYCVHLYMLMRIMGLEDIVILTAYNGQKCLIEDIVKKKCSWNNKIGAPLVSTIDKYQGRQSNYVIVSLVRTKNVGYLRDPRRFVVATSRSKLGLYVVGRRSLIQNIKELAVFNKHLNQYPSNLHLRVTEEEERGSDCGKEDRNKEEEEVAEIRNNKELEELVHLLM